MAQGTAVPLDPRYERNAGSPPIEETKAGREWKRGWDDTFMRVVRCAWCDWTTVGDGATTREQFNEHRKGCERP